MKINLHIERLILDGLAIGHGHGSFVESDVEKELVRLLAANGLNPAFRSGGTVNSAKAEGIQLNNDTSTADLCNQIAHAVYGAIGKV